MPSSEDAAANARWLQSRGIVLAPEDWMVAPSYQHGPLVDERLLAAVEERHPSFVIINLGGGVQERLGHFLKDRLSWRPTIICTGAAIAFLSGRQANIPRWADRMALGWLLRILNDPRRFIPRYWRALRLAPLVWKNGIDAPTSARDPA
jgi:UDP-N-acetyl-D-mannosaminuronic acid transferase (WecB/TagA/CpsF family)